VCAGVALHVPDYVMARHDHFMTAGMPMSRRMWTGMALIAAGLALAAWGLLPGPADRAVRSRRPATAGRFAALDQAPLGRAHRVPALVETARVMERYGVRAVPPEPDEPAVAAPALAPVSLLAAPYRPRSLGIIVYGLSWGVVNWGFITFLPVFLTAAGAGTQASRLLFLSSLLALPTTAFAAVLYARWSSRRSMLAYSAGTVVVLVLFAVLSPQQPGRAGLLVVLVSVLLSGIAGMIAMLSPYAAEVHPTTLRATGSGMAAASSKVGGMFGPLLLTSAPGIETLAVISALPVAVAAAVFWRAGLETAGRPLVELAPQPVTTTEQEG